MPKKLSTDFVKRQIRKYGGSVKKNWEYVNNRTLIDIKCSQGHKFSMRYADISQGHWCPYCYGNGQPTTKEVKNFLRKKGGKTLRNWEYVNNRSPIKIFGTSKHLRRPIHAYFGTSKHLRRPIHAYFGTSEHLRNANSRVDKMSQLW
jgi:hypothetical protein